MLVEAVIDQVHGIIDQHITLFPYRTGIAEINTGVIKHYGYNRFIQQKTFQFNLVFSEPGIAVRARQFQQGIDAKFIGRQMIRFMHPPLPVFPL